MFDPEDLPENERSVACRDQHIMMQFQGAENRGKISMKELFGKRNVTKDGKEGKVSSSLLAVLTARIQ